MDERYLLAAVRYVENNPVRAGLCTVAGQWRWSSAAAHLQGSDDELVNVSPMLDLVADWEGYLQEDTEDSLIEEIHRHMRTGRRLGSDTFIERLEERLQRTLRRGKPGPKRKRRGSDTQDTFLEESGK
jgi:putative transposase